MICYGRSLCHFLIFHLRLYIVCVLLCTFGSSEINFMPGLDSEPKIYCELTGEAEGLRLKKYNT